jgi:hypothetical protein
MRFATFSLQKKGQKYLEGAIPVPGSFLHVAAKVCNIAPWNGIRSDTPQYPD